MRSIDGRQIRCSLLGVLASLAGVAACSSFSDGPIGASSAALVTVSPNAVVVPFNMHTVAVTQARLPGGGWQWVAGVDNCSWATPTTGALWCDESPAPAAAAGFVGTLWSTDGLGGQSWGLNLPQPGCEEGTGGSPGPFSTEPCDAATWIPPGAPTQGGTFAGWTGSSTVASVRKGDPVTDGTVVLLAQSTWSNNSADAHQNSDNAVLISRDGGSSWGTPFYLVDQTYHAGGGDVTRPQIVSNPNPPYSTFAAWTNNLNDNLHLAGWITSINNQTLQPNSSSSASNTWDMPNPTSWNGQAHVAKQILDAPTNYAMNPRMAVTNVAMPYQAGSTLCDGQSHEMLIVGWSNETIGGSACSNGVPPHGVTWTGAVFDNTANVWSDPFSVGAQWSPCVGALTTDPSRFNPNEPDLSIAASGPLFAWAHNAWTPIGSRIRVEGFGIPQPSAADCTNNHLSAPNPTWVGQAPDYCYFPASPGWCQPAPGNLGGGNGPNGENITNDQWGARIAFLPKGQLGELLVSWYGTSGDQTNSLVQVRGAMSTAGLVTSPFVLNGAYTINAISIANPNEGENVPWNITQPWWWGQTIATDDAYGQSFFVAWGGDARNVSSDGTNGFGGVFGATVTC